MIQYNTEKLCEKTLSEVKEETQHIKWECCFEELEFQTTNIPQVMDNDIFLDNVIRN